MISLPLFNLSIGPCHPAYKQAHVFQIFKQAPTSCPRMLPPAAPSLAPGTCNPKATFKPYQNTWSSISVHFSFLLLYTLCFAWISFLSLPPSISSIIPSSGKPFKTPTEELGIPPFYNITEYQMDCKYLLADLSPPSDCRILVGRYKILLIICVSPLAGWRRS